MDTTELTKLHASGLSNRQIATTMGYSHRTVGDNLKKLGLSPNGRRRATRLIDGDLSMCSVCGLWKNTTDFAKGRSGRSDWYYLTYCKSCRRVQQRNRVNSDIEVYMLDKWRRTKVRAGLSGVIFTITRDEWMHQWNEQRGLCFYTDIELVGRVGEGAHPNSVSADKVIPELGYVLGNVVFCANRINTIKNNASLEEMKRWMPDWFERIDMWRAKGLKCLQVQPGEF